MLLISHPLKYTNLTKLADILKKFPSVKLYLWIKKRLEAYSKLINLLVGNPSEATAILKTHPDLIDANFLQIMKQASSVYTKSGQYDIANWLQNLAFSLEADLFFQQGIGYLNSNQFQEAVQLWKKALNIYREIGNRHKEAFSLNYLGVTYKLLGEYKQAIEYHQQSLKIAHQQDYREEKANSLGNLGNVYKLLGEYKQAIKHHQQSLKIAREIFNHQQEVNCLDNLGNVYQSLEQYNTAIESMGLKMPESIALHELQAL